MTETRSLYECFHARVKGSWIRCERRHRLSPWSKAGGIGVERLARGEPLELDVCRGCPDFDRMGPPLPSKERGWAQRKTMEKSKDKGGKRCPGEERR